MNEIDWFKILKWVVIVLIAGFIGQFGKMLATHLVARAGIKKKTASEALVQKGKAQDAENRPALQNAAEKSGEMQINTAPESLLPTSEAPAQDEKKALKNSAKQRKKEDKLKKK